ncbi:MAG: hydrogenase maturation nickel metallochaperone HypA [Kiritimatiellia bacterium]|jgi:hydrogenase nickel incorporation protein HypA/HybF|nr:hydrogenase maturation nickel metallochaperone HypA [Kiritimatiellia bacterium]MDP6847547.1 hydrogenase maturation nickel metallochaperone HypA [Kiritimatiellia bacterium]
MHELSIATALVEQVERAMQQESASRVTKVNVRVGTLSGVDKEALEMAFPLASEDGCCSTADLVVELVQARIECNACGKASEPESLFFACEYCGAVDVNVISGRELMLQSLEIQDNE